MIFFYKIGTNLFFLLITLGADATLAFGEMADNSRNDVINTFLKFLSMLELESFSPQLFMEKYL